MTRMEDFNGTYFSGFNILQNKWNHMDSEWHEVKFIRCLSDRAAVSVFYSYTLNSVFWGNYYYEPVQWLINNQWIMCIMVISEGCALFQINKGKISIHILHRPWSHLILIKIRQCFCKLNHITVWHFILLQND